MEVNGNLNGNFGLVPYNFEPEFTENELKELENLEMNERQAPHLSHLCLHRLSFKFHCL